ncbi:MAG: type II toxin-antitoxin system VapC family toxin [Chloroflexota bacterium]
MITAVADTHAVIWYIYADSRLSAIAKTAIDSAAQAGDQIGVSAITLVEMVYLVEKGRISSESFSILATSLKDAENVFTEIPMNLEIARMITTIDAAQIPDMPDRIIAATAQDPGVPVISRDSQIQLSNVTTIW